MHQNVTNKAVVCAPHLIEMFRQPQPQPDLNHAVLEGPLGELVALLIHDHPIHHVGVPSDSSQSPALQLQAVDDAVLLPVPTQLDGEL